MAMKIELRKYKSFWKMTVTDGEDRLVFKFESGGELLPILSYHLQKEEIDKAVKISRPE
jgi:hypothetical protein